MLFTISTCISQTRKWTADNDDTDLVFSSEASQSAYTQALNYRRRRLYQDAINALETVIECEVDSDKLWAELALTQFMLWEAYVRALHTPSIIVISSTIQSKRLRGQNAVVKPLHIVLLQEAYTTLLIAMEYPKNKGSLELLYPLVNLYIEFGSYRGALAVCTLLVEGYPSSSRLNEAIFLSALTASALNRHRDSAQYFQYLAEGKGTSSQIPHRLGAYQLSLLAALELSHVPSMGALERETYTQAYKALIALPPVLPSEKTVHFLLNTSRKNQEQRTILWYRDGQTWLDLADRLAPSANAPLLVLSVLREACQRIELAPSNLPAPSLVLEVLVMRAHLQAFTRRIRILATWRLGVAYVLKQRRHAMALRIQCAWREFNWRQEIALLRVQQQQKEALANAEMGNQDDRTIEKHLDAAAMKIQSLLYIIRDKGIVRALRARKIKRKKLIEGFAVRYFKLVRLLSFRFWCNFASVQRQTRLHACVLIQRQFRVWCNRKSCAHLLLRRSQRFRILQECLVRRSTSLLSRVFQAWHQILLKAKSQRLWGVKLIQNKCRSRIAVLQYHAELRRHRIAIDTMNRLLLKRKRKSLVHFWRALSNNALARRLEQRGAAQTIQKHMRGVLARKGYNRLRRRRRRALNALAKIMRSCDSQLLQTGFKLLQQHVLEYHRVRYNAARCIQRLLQGFEARQKLQRRCLAQTLVIGIGTSGNGLRSQPSKIKLLACLLALSQYILQRDAALVQVQRWWRHRRCKFRLLRVLHKRTAQRWLIGRLQHSFHMLARALFRELRTLRDARKARQYLAATKIQCRLQCWLIRRHYLSNRDRRLVAAQRGAKAVKKYRVQQMHRCLNGWKEATRVLQRELHEAACIVQRIFRRRHEQRRARRTLAKMRTQAEFLAAALQKPLVRCFRQWEVAALLEKSILRVRSSSVIKSLKTAPASHKQKQGIISGSKFDKLQTFEERAEIPSIFFFTLLNRVRQTGMCQLSFSGGADFTIPQLRQLISLSTTLIVDGGGDNTTISSFISNSPVNLIEQVVNALDACSSSTSYPSPVQSLILCNSPLRAYYASQLSTLLLRSHRNSSFSLMSVVLANVPLLPASVVDLACSLAQNPGCLQQLVLERCQIGSAGAAALFESLNYNRALWKLDLSGNHIADVACPALARALISGSQLRVLSLSSNSLSDRIIQGCLAPALALSHLDTLVLLQNPRVSSAGIAALRQARLNVISDYMYR
ncbi:LRR-containing protein [Plasmopara halstedii]|uniref:LRR-containing protein n=1 Tax=Plasmopara halstedii TaxID=4781 RepID=A0A0P1ASZ5_PLAHL|nr:LRR-containing protein [Plasmopara halstedii]CEG45383.1 LRR-containing protein [Plasmopara halstedii]|eukprot:XP_024581752.1 LRR-containing protein [Plasmopara halstedii]